MLFGAMHKLAKRYRETLARTTSNEDNMRDVLRRLNFRSDPVVIFYGEKYYRCGICNEIGYNKRICELLATGLDVKTASLLFVESGIENEKGTASSEKDSDHSPIRSSRSSGDIFQQDS